MLVPRILARFWSDFGPTPLLKNFLHILAFPLPQSGSFLTTDWLESNEIVLNFSWVNLDLCFDFCRQSSQFVARPPEP